jgi:hypothetical protein
MMDDDMEARNGKGRHVLYVKHICKHSEDFRFGTGGLDAG